jgi:threonine dehydratase
MFADGVAVKRIGEETFRLCQQYIDGHIAVSSDEICSAVKDIFEDTRAIAEPSGALALAGLKKFAEQNQLQDKQLATVLSGANTNFHGLRYVSERCELGEKREGLLAVTIPERQGAFLEFCNIIGGRAVTEFNYRHNDESLANIFVGVRLQGGQEELEHIINDLREGGYPVVDLSDDEMAKLHIRYMIGGKPSKPLKERLYSFEFPEYPGALIKFLDTLGTHWNISLFNYRNHGADYGRVLCGFELGDDDLAQFSTHLEELGYQCKDETDNPSYKFFLS